MPSDFRREVLGRNAKCPLCERSFAERSSAGTSTFVHEEAGRVHLFCSLKPELWVTWLQRTGRAPLPVDVEVVDSKENSK